MIGTLESLLAFFYICTKQTEHPDEDETVSIEEEISEVDIVENTVPDDKKEVVSEEDSEEMNEKAKQPCKSIEDDSTAELASASSADESEIEAKRIELGVIDEIFDFVQEFDSSSVNDALQASASISDTCGGITKPAIFEHPLNEGDAKVEYHIQLPKISENERLIICFNIGLRDGVNFNDSERTPDGVLFALELNGERLFEKTCITCQWSPEQVIDISHLAEQEIQVVFVTNCNGNSNYDWALWGEPRVLLLSKVEKSFRIPLIKEEQPAYVENVTFTRGMVLGQLENEPPQIVCREYSFPEGKYISEIAELARQKLEEIWQKPVTLTEVYSYQPKLKLVSLGPTTGVVVTKQDFDVRCVIKNIGKVPLLEEHNATISLSGIKLRRDRMDKRLGEIEPNGESEITWQIRPFHRETTTTMTAHLKLPTAKSVITKAVHEVTAVRRSRPLLFAEPRYNRDKLREPKGEAVGERSEAVHEVTAERSEAENQSRKSSGRQFEAERSEQINASLVIERDVPKLTTKSSEELRLEENNEGLLMENEFMRIVFVRGDNGFGYYTISIAKDGNCQQVAVGHPISKFAYRDSTGVLQSVAIRPKEYKLEGNNRGESSIVFTAEEKDVDGILWHFTGRFTIGERLKRMKTTYQLRAEGDRDLVHFRGPMLRIGDGTFGTRKDFALFPGLEYLELNEPSSGTRDAAPPINLRLAPHPYKITIPLMAIEDEQCLVGLIWNPLLKWDGEHDMLSAIFASPNWHERQDNHLMGLFLPTVPDWIPENLGRIGELRKIGEENKPYPLKADTTLTINAEIIAHSKRGRDSHPLVLDAIVHWTDAYGIPEPLEPPRSDEEELLLSRHGFMHSVWDEETQKSRHCVDWAPINCPGFATLLWYDYLATQDSEVKERVELIAQNTIRDAGIGGLASTAGCHILKWEFPFYYGEIEAVLATVKESVEDIIVNQGEDGSWRFHPNERTKNLGKEGDAVLGTCAANALSILKYARISGDETALQAGQKALEFMDRFRIPRGAQAWECPLYEPDILAAALAIGAYVEAYRITKERRYLNQAEYWAKTGLPFLFFWNDPERPGMRYASIPVFGTTFYTHSWFGVPVQWNGLVYAYYLQQLSEYSGIFPWKQIAEGITVSAMYQQWTEGELKGTYPDGFYGYCTEGRGPHINPEDIMVNLYALRGLDPDISTAIVSISPSFGRNSSLASEDSRIHISSGAKVQNATISSEDADGESLKFDLRYGQDEISYTLIRGFGKLGTESSFYSVTANGETLPEVENLQDISTDCYSYREPDTVYLKALHPMEAINIEVKRGEVPQEQNKEVESPTPPVEYPNETEETTPEEKSEVILEEQPVEEVSEE